jgi:hypothetical protein
MWLKGTLDYNLSLSNRRAKAVVSRLSSQSGISIDRLVPPGLGQLAPLASNDTEKDRATAWGCDFKRTELSRRSIPMEQRVFTGSFKRRKGGTQFCRSFLAEANDIPCFRSWTCRE